MFHGNGLHHVLINPTYTACFASCYNATGPLHIWIRLSSVNPDFSVISTPSIHVGKLLFHDVSRVRSLIVLFLFGKRGLRSATRSGKPSWKIFRHWNFPFVPSKDLQCRVCDDWRLVEGTIVRDQQMKWKKNNRKRKQICCKDLQGTIWHQKTMQSMVPVLFLVIFLGLSYVL
jgi:hypothetical protein